MVGCPLSFCPKAKCQPLKKPPAGPQGRTVSAMARKIRVDGSPWRCSIRRRYRQLARKIMTDIVSKQTRSRMMSSVRAKNTKLELEVRRRLFAMGFRYRLHQRALPGTPDMVFPKYTAVIFVHGCFWHGHGCDLSALPHTRRMWWKKKLDHNRLHDGEVVARLKELGWRVLVIWECSFRKPHTNRSDALDRVASRAGRFLKSRKSELEISQFSRCRQNRKG